MVINIINTKKLLKYISFLEIKMKLQDLELPGFFKKFYKNLTNLYPVQEKAVKATYKDGILSLSLTKNQELKVPPKKLIKIS